MICGVLTLGGIVPLTISVCMMAGGSGVNIFDLLFKKLGLNKGEKYIKRKAKLYQKYFNRLYYFKAKFLADGHISNDEYDEFITLIMRLNKKVEEVEEISKNSSERHDE